MAIPEGEKRISQLLDKRIKAQLLFYLAIFLAFVGVVVFQIISHELSWTYPLIAVALGTVIGLIVSRVFYISWDRGAGRVIARLDTVGIIIFLAYAAFEFFQEKYLHYFVHGPIVVAISFSVLSGAMLGRVMGIRKNVRKILKEQDFIS